MAFLRVRGSCPAVGEGSHERQSARREEIPPVADHYLRKYGELKKGRLRLNDAAFEYLLLYAWPGNRSPSGSALVVSRPSVTNRSSIGPVRCSSPGHKDCDRQPNASRGINENARDGSEARKLLSNDREKT